MTERVAVIHDGFADTPGGAAKVATALAETLDADLYVGRAGKPTWYEERVEGEVTLFAGRANSLPTVLRDAMVAYETGRLHLPEYDTVVTTGVPAKFYQPESHQLHHHYAHHPPLRYTEWLGRDTLTGLGNLRYLVRKAAMYADWIEMQRVRRTLANSRTTRDRIDRHYGLDATVVNPPIEYDERSVLATERREDYFLSAGRLGERKRLDTLILAFARTDERLVLCGDGPLREELADLAEETGADVEFRGFVSDDEVVEAMRKAKGGVFIPVEEDFGMAIAECLCYGTPLIVTDEPNPKYMIDDGSGRRVEPTVDAVTEAVREFDPSAFDPESIAAEARERYGAERFTAEVREALREERTI
ncbi:glycosyltransferase [Halobaculum magnesiiphilum]|uniref:Glycosyltransferase n=1 Tax=Halobaculum magnesiiphilum TaxID=1017351 RepID=A0A8T8WCB8_9EURY|nr:glycosyltransferase [Halobaculum magnesiiphilum]QZP37512.1 glycosyltransferase [Halobaculum magnesiiphilum]